ncbi:N-acetylmuramoyl-L-alanine amidase [Terasakiella pusilla]|uniref:N-acetylmuramoyl-L-alanine amidase n=1 Tax=Terasakiella pusilla TaxID=64973 RepID=UPI003AA7BCD9
MDIQFIVVHCSDTPNGRYHTAEDIHRWHLDRGWDGIGYHSVIRTDGLVDQGRPHYWIGSHTAKYNGIAIGVCLIGRDEFSDEQWRSLEGLMLSLTNEFPNAKVVGHRDLNSHKTCPNFDVKAWWAGVQARGID